MKRYIRSASDQGSGRQDAELLMTDGSWELWTPHTFEASIYLARKGADRNHWARWDTAYEGNGSWYFDQFTKKGPLYIFINKADPTNKYQYHAETDSFYDWNDRPADFESFICEHPAFAEFFGIDCNGVEACDKITASTYGYPEHNLYADRRKIAHLLHKEIEDALKSKFPEDDYYLSGNIIDGDTIGFKGFTDEKTSLYAPIIKDVLKKYKINARASSNTHIGKYISFRLYNTSDETDALLIDLLETNGGAIDACDRVTANSDTEMDLPTFKEFATTEWEFLNDGSKRLQLKDLFVYFGTDKQWNASDPGYWYEIKVGDKTYKESEKYSIKNKERCYKAMQRAVSELLQSDNIESCDRVTASTRPHPSIPAGWERVPEGDDDEGDWTTISKELPNNGGYIWLDLLYDDNDRRYYELQIGYRNSDGTIGDIHPLISKEFYRLGDAVDYAEDRINRESNSEEDIESCDTVTASEICYRDRDNDNRVVALDAGMSDEEVEAMLAAHPSYYRSTLDEIDSTADTEYFANMVNCSSDPELDDNFLIEGYYDGQYRGLAESAETSDISALNELAWEYANKGYYFRLHNLSDGTIFEFAPDNWINDIAPDGGAELFMSW